MGSSICSPVVGVEAVRSFSELWCEVVGSGVLLLEEVPLRVPLSCPLGHVLSDVTCHPLCMLTEYTVVGTASPPASAMGMQAVSSDAPHGAVLTKPPAQIHWHRSTGVRCWDLPWELRSQPGG